LGQAPGFTAITAGTLALGIGATAAIFTVIHGILLSPLPYPNPDRIVAVTTGWTSGRVSPRIAGGDFADIRQQASAFEELAYFHGGEVGVQLPNDAAFAPVFWTTVDFFRVLGLAPVTGRLFDDTESAAVVSEDFAARHFGKASTALGQHLSVEDRSYQIVGVVRPIRYPRGAEVWLSGGFAPPNLDRTVLDYQAIGRMRDGISLERAQRDLDTVGSRLASEFPGSDRQKRFTAVPLRDLLVGRIRPTLLLVFAAVLLVLSMACANAASLLLSRATARRHEVAVRVSLGASIWHLLRQFLVEGFILGSLGGAAGMALAVASTRILVRFAPSDLPRLETLHADWSALALTATVSLLTSMVFGLAPLFQPRLLDPGQALASGNRAIGGRRVHRIRTALLTGEIALAFALTVAAGLLVRSLAALDHTSLGYETHRRLIMYAHAPARTRDEYVRVSRFLDTLLGELRHLPGIVSAAMVMGLPGGQYGSSGSYVVEGGDPASVDRELPDADFALTSAGYFSDMGIPSVSGRDFTSHDDDQSPSVAIINEALAREGFQGTSPIGRRITCRLDDRGPMTIIGVVGDVRRHSPGLPPGPQIYMPLAQHPYFANEVQVVLRTTMDPQAGIEAVGRMVRSRSPEIAMKFTTLDRIVSDSVGVPRFRAFLFATFSALALGLTLAGVYGLMSYLGVLRTAEFGVRLALGARPVDVALLMLGQAARFAAVGLAAGAVGAIAIAHLASSLLFGVGPLDPVAFGGAAAALVATMVLGAILPAWRAGRMDPVRAIRSE
jgi:predicted permease